MSKLKVYVKPLKTNILGKTIVGQSYYSKSEADKVIAEKDKEIARLKSDLADLWDEKKTTDAIINERNAEIAEKFKEAK